MPGACAPRSRWGQAPGQGIGIDEAVPPPSSSNGGKRAPLARAGLTSTWTSPLRGLAMAGATVDVCFIGPVAPTVGSVICARAAGRARGRRGAANQGFCGALAAEQVARAPLKPKGSIRSSRRRV